MKNVLVTGGTGFLGAHLIQSLIQKGDKVTALRRASSRMDLVKEFEAEVKWIEGDVNDVFSLEDAMEGVSQVYHVAGMVSFDPRDKEKLLKVNVEGTANVVNVALEKGIKKLVYVSSIAALGRKKNTNVINEDAEWEDSDLNSNYAISKFKAECEVWRGMAEGLKAVVINPSVIVGPGYWNEPGSSALFTKIWEGLPFYPDGVTGFVDVRDVTVAMIELMNSDITEERFVLNGDNLSWKNFFGKVASELSKKAPTKTASPFAIEIAWRMEWIRSRITGKRPLITRETALSSSHKFYYDNSKIIEFVPDFVFTPLDNTIEDTAQSFLESFPKGISFGKLIK